MKPQLDLYLFTAASFAGCFPFVCRLVEKAYQQGHGLLINLGSTEEADSFDQLLWTFKNTSFIPHLKTADDAVTVSKLHAPIPNLVINCRLLTTPEPINVPRLLQIVPNQPNLLQLARQHYRYYQQQGCQINTHQIK